ncbi:septum formation family protein [Micromonospora sp. WMMA1363]|uniref:septum formation family protein n=1 Tax=Micromonospora sp. WMMA1363 TaxID=3053985 RepID=UPI00259CD2CF|nr:septum formation family protein [Micromonospora sp. WMMA1363]MDM4721252.1 septum formation family protein [Micromonospora sp. WMMA1363]
MRQRVGRGILTVIAAGALLGGCAGETDGDLTDDWKSLPAAGPFTPEAGVCHLADFAAVVPLDVYQPVDCAVPHRVETVHVGSFPAAQEDPPAGGSADFRGAFADCDTRVVEYVGDDWRVGRLRLSVAVPSATGWTSGSRWYRCDLTEMTTAEAAATAVTRVGGLRNALAGPSPLRLGCQRSRRDAGGGVATLLPVECAVRHDAEFVGVWRAPDRPYPARDADWASLYAGCRSAIARHVGVPDDVALRFRADVVVRPPGAGRWRVGDRGVRCYLWLSDRTTIGSLKGAGPAGLPVRSR